MKQFISLLCALAILWPSLALATEPVDPKGDFFTVDHRWEIYDKTKKSSGTAVLCTLAFPGVGNLYAEQYFVGAAFVAVGVFSLIFVTFGLTTNQDDLIVFGAVTGGSAYIASGITAALGAQSHNEQLRRALALPEERAALESRGVTLTFAF